MSVSWLESKDRAWLIAHVKAYDTMCADIENVLAEALGYPVGGPDYPGGEGNYVVGEHDALTLAREASHELKKLYQSLKDKGCAT